MENIWYIFGTVGIMSIVLLTAAVIFFIKKEEHYILINLIIIAIVVFSLISDIPYMKDLAKQETTEVIAVYVEYQTGNVHPGARRLFFENEEDEFNLLAPVITKDCVKMKVGKKYKIEYFNNSRVIKNYELIE
jgi:hypothetical protein